MTPPLSTVGVELAYILYPLFYAARARPPVPLLAVCAVASIMHARRFWTYREVLLQTELGTELVFALPLLVAFLLTQAAPFPVQLVVATAMGVVLFLSHKTKEKNDRLEVQYVSWYDPFILVAATVIGLGSRVGRPFLGDATYHALELALT